MKKYLDFERRAVALALVAVLCAGMPLSAFALDSENTQEPEQNTVQTAESDTISGANTALIPVQELSLEEVLEEQANQPQTFALTPSQDTSGQIVLNWIKYKGEATPQQDVTMNLTDFLVGVTYTEMGSILGYTGVSSEAAAETWKAQAVAIHTYQLYLNRYGSASNALIFTPLERIPENTRNAIRAAVSQVENLLVVYGTGSDAAGYQVCDTVYSCSGGYNTQTGVYGTCAGIDAWGTETPYLQSVESKYERKYHDFLRESIGSGYTYVESKNSAKPEEDYVSADTTHKSLGGFVQYNTLVVNGVSYSYLNRFVSSRYCFDFDDANKAMNYYGYGHGVGMTQCGALGYAVEEGWNYSRILQHYYSGTSLYDAASGQLQSSGVPLEAEYAAVYDYDYYITHNPDVKQVFVGDRYQTVQHFIDNGMREGRQGSESFNVQTYRANYPDLQDAYGDDLKSYYMHYITYGKSEGRDAVNKIEVVYSTVLDGVDYSAVFNAKYYSAQYADLQATFGEDGRKLLEHFVNNGMREGRQAIESFNVYIYRANYPDLQEAFGSDLKRYFMHYIVDGQREGRDAVNKIEVVYPPVLDGVDYSAVFNAKYYSAQYADLQAAFGEDSKKLLEHFVNNGMREGRQAIEGFNVNIYRANYPDLQNAFGDDLKSYYLHYISNGKSEGRDAENVLTL